jgi:CRP-like cAMP-binding protein
VELNQIEDFFRRQPANTVPAGELVIRPWDQRDSVIFVQSGFLKIFSTTRRGREITVTYFNPAKHCGNVAFSLEDEFRRYSIEALTPVVIRKVLRSEFVAFLDQHPEICRGMSLCLASLVKDLFEQIEALKSGSSYQRLSSCLYCLARELGQETSPGRTINCRLTHRMLASLTGLTRETVTIQLRQLKQKGLVDYQRHIYQVPDLEKLRVETGFLD